MERTDRADGSVQERIWFTAPTCVCAAPRRRCPGCAVAGSFCTDIRRVSKARPDLPWRLSPRRGEPGPPGVCPAGPRRHRSRLRCWHRRAASANRAISPPTATARSTMCPMAAAPWCSSPNRCSRPWRRFPGRSCRVLLMSPQGRPLQQADLRRWPPSTTSWCCLRSLRRLR